jgi:hypothetical protein
MRRPRGRNPPPCTVDRHRTAAHAGNDERRRRHCSLGGVAPGDRAHPAPRRLGHPAAPLGSPARTSPLAGNRPPVDPVVPNRQRTRHPARRLAAATRQPLRGTGRNRARFPLRSGTPFAEHRIQSRHAQAGSRLLRPAGFGMPPRQLHQRREWPASPGALVPSGPAARPRRGAARSRLLERVDVRIPHALARDAHLRGHPAARDLHGIRPPPDPLRTARRHPLGHFRVRLQPGRCAPHLPVSPLRRSVAGHEAGTRR